MKSYKKLKTHFKQLTELHDLQRVLQWDEAVMMPEGAGPTRAQAQATLDGIAHKLLSTKKNKRLLELAKQENLSHWDKANLQWMEKRYQQAVCIPTKLTEKLTTQAMACQQAWRKLRAQNNWKDFLPMLTRVFKLVQEVAKRRGDALGLKPYDAMLDEYAPGFNQETIENIFSDLKQCLPELIRKITAKQQNETVKTPVGPFTIEKQKQIGLKIMTAMDFDFRCGRLDISHHPFCGGSPSDVRITTRYNDKEFFTSLAGICHETGHGLYEQGLPVEWRDQPVGAVNSMAMHESQSLLIESLVCNSPAFYRYLVPLLQEQFGMQEAFTAENLYKLATRVEPILIRVDSDEVTYPMHVILRFEIEKCLFSGELNIKDLPSYWNELMQQYLGLSTQDDYKDGVMQDVHWPAAAFGYFPAYTLGRLISAQLFSTFIAEHPQFFAELAQGNFKSIHQWLQKNVYSVASSQTTDELLMNVTGKPLDASFFVEHLRIKYLDN